MNELRGPADADGFRVKIGRYGDRWYHVPLPGDHIAPASEWIGPAVTTCKKASGNDWSFVALKRVATAMETDTYHRLDLQPLEHRYEALKTINKLGLEQAGRRGTNVHLMFEAGLHGRKAIVAPDAPGIEYRAAVDQFFDQYKPTLFAAEFVCIHHTLNGVGYGGTADAIIDIDGKKFLVDWKSRGIDSDHGAYPEEAAQVGALAGAEYIIIEGHNGPERRLMPDLDGGLIVSIKPDGCRVYPIDLDKGFTHWTALHAWWCARRDERDAVGRQWPARKNSPGAPCPSAPVTAGEVESADPTASPALSFADFDKPMVQAARVEALAWAAQPAPDPVPPLPANPDEGRGIQASMFADLKADYNAGTVDTRAWISQLVSEAQRANVGFHTQGHHTERRYQIIRGLVTFTEGGNWDWDGDVLRALCVAALNNDAPLHPAHTLGACVGSLNAVQASRFVQLVDDYLVAV